MREIKFRAWRVVNNKNECKMIKQDSFLTIARFFSKMERDSGAEYKLMQYTGLLDKNGVEIYEGDIVKLKYVSYPLEVKYNTVLACFQMGKEHRFTALQDVEVIGNIWENKELLDDSE